MLRSLLAAALVVVPAPAVPQTEPAPSVPKVLCRHEHGYSAGTAFRIGPHLLVSVNHVTSASRCEIDGEPIHVIYASPKADFSILSDARSGKWLKVDCSGFVAGHRYVAVGHARAMDELTLVPMVATGSTFGSLSLLAGIFTAQPGQSGGPIMDAETGRVVGTVNTAEWSRGLTGSVELKGTSICGGSAA
jgi:hypothetical protein